MKTERALELLRKFKKSGISQEPNRGLDDVLEWQDIIGRSSLKELQFFEEELAPLDRETFHWTNMNTLSYTLAVEVMRSTLVHRKVNEAIGRYESGIEARETALFNREERFRNAKKHIYKKLEKERKNNSILRDRRDNILRQRDLLLEEKRAIQRKSSVCAEKAEKFEKVKELLS